MSKRAQLLELEVAPDEALAGCRAAVAELGWEVSETGEDRLATHQDPAKLCCHDWPVEVVIEVVEAGERRTCLGMKASVPGRGPISSRSLGSSLAALERAIQRSLA